MKKLLLIVFFLTLPSPFFGQTIKVTNDVLGKQIGLHFIYYHGRITGGVSLNKLPNVNGKEYYAFVWSNSEYDKKEEKTTLRFQSTSEEIDTLFETFKRVIKTKELKELRLEDKTVIIKPSAFNEDVYFVYEVAGLTKYFFIKAIGIYELFGKTFDKKEWEEYLKN